MQDGLARHIETFKKAFPKVMMMVKDRQMLDLVVSAGMQPSQVGLPDEMGNVGRAFVILTIGA